MVHDDDRPRNQMMEDNFTDIIDIERKISQHRCNHCEHQSVKVSFKTQQHLNQCTKFQLHQEETKKKKKKKLTQLLIDSMIRFFLQTHLNRIYSANVMIVYMTNISFNHYENCWVVESYKSLHSSYKFSHRKLLAGKLLDETYKSVKVQVMKRLNACNNLNFFTDETANIRKKRVINFCCHVSSSDIFRGEEFHFKAMTDLIEKMNAATQTD